MNSDISMSYALIAFCSAFLVFVIYSCFKMRVFDISNKYSFGSAFECEYNHPNLFTDPIYTGTNEDGSPSYADGSVIGPQG